MRGRSPPSSGRSLRPRRVPGAGRLVGGLARDLILTVPEAEIAVLTCREGAALAGCIILMRLAFAEDAGVVVLLSPVGVATVRQGRGIG